MLRFAEEITLTREGQRFAQLVALLNDDGTLVHVPSWSLNYALAGGVLMDLALENRIDTDLEKLVLIDSTPIGDSLLDPTLADINEVGERDARFWVERTASRAQEIREESLSRLISLGILEARDDRFLWVFRSRRYPAIEGTTVREVKLRIMEVLFSDEIPDPRDVVIICLADACGIFRRLLSRAELSRASERIEQVSRLDLIGQAMSQAIQDIQLTIATSVRGHI